MSHGGAPNQVVIRAEPPLCALCVELCCAPRATAVRLNWKGKTWEPAQLIPTPVVLGWASSSGKTLTGAVCSLCICHGMCMLRDSTRNYCVAENFENAVLLVLLIQGTWEPCLLTSVWLMLSLCCFFHCHPSHFHGNSVRLSVCLILV